MEAREATKLLDDVNTLVATHEAGADAGAGSVDPALLNAVADFIEGADPAGAGLQQLREALQAAAGESDDSPKQRMKVAGCSRAIGLLREEVARGRR